jgi:hypothetical protein
VSKMASHEPFGHMQHKLWSKERSGVKLAVWLLTIKSQESTRSGCVQVKCDTPSESSWRELQVCFTSSQSEVWTGSYELPKSRESKPGQFRDSFLGVLEQKKVIWMQVPWRGTENTIWGKVVDSPESGPWWVRVAHGLS